jgi:hypothetical protein
MIKQLLYTYCNMSIVMSQSVGTMRPPSNLLRLVTKIL